MLIRATLSNLTLVLKLYGISTLDPQVWETVDHEKEGPLAGTLTGEDGGASEEIDPLGLRNRLTPYVFGYTDFRVARDLSQLYGQLIAEQRSSTSRRAPKQAFRRRLSTQRSSYPRNIPMRHTRTSGRVSSTSKEQLKIVAKPCGSWSRRTLTAS